MDDRRTQNQEVNDFRNETRERDNATRDDLRQHYVEDGYTKREHDLIFNDIRESLLRIETQTTTTNGKVANITAWREQVAGGSKVAGIILIPMLIWGFMVLRDMPGDIQDAIKKELTNKYNIEIK